MTSVMVFGVSGSPRKKGNTALMVKEALKGAKEVGDVKIEFLDLSEIRIEPCKGCLRCWREKALRCLSIDDDMIAVYPKIMDSDGLILGSPVYFGTITAQLKSFMDRTVCLGACVDYKLKYKVGGGITVGANRHGGQEYALTLILNYFLLMGGVAVGGTPPHAYWGSAGVATDRGEIERDDWAAQETRITAFETARSVGRRVAHVAKLIKAGTTIEGEKMLEL